MRLGSLGNFSIFQDQQGAIEGLITVGSAKIGTTRPVWLVEDEPRHCPSPALLFAPISLGLQICQPVSLWPHPSLATVRFSVCSFLPFPPNLEDAISSAYI